MKKTFKQLSCLILVILIVISLFSTCTLPAFARQPGSSFSDPIIMLENIPSSYSLSDLYTTCYQEITIPSRGYITITSNSTDGDDTSLTYYLYNSEHDILWRSATSFQTLDDNNNYVYKIGLEKGTYCLSTQKTYASHYDKPTVTNTYSFTATDYWEIEDNNTKETATQIDLENTYSGTYCEQSHDYEDWYKIYLTKNSRYVLTINNGMILDKAGAWLRIYKPDAFSSLFSSFDDESTIKGDNCIWDFTAQETGYHYINLCQKSRRDPVDYSVSVKKFQPTSADKLTITASKKAFTYNGKKQVPTITIKTSSGSTVAKDNYTITYPTSSIKSGSYTIKINFKKDYTGTKYVKYQINPASYSKLKISLSETKFAYNKKTISPNVIVKDSAGKTVNSSNYSISRPKASKKIGTYKIKVTFKGNYSGSKTLSYKILPTTKTSIKTAIGTKVKIGAKSNSKIKYSSSNKKIAKVSSSGVITPVKNGKATITIKSGDITQKLKVTVSKPSVKISAPKSSVYRNSKLKLTATTNPAGAKVKWSVNNKKIATVSSSGVVTGKKYGTVKVTAKITYKGKTYKSTYKVKVKVSSPSISLFAGDGLGYSTAFAINLENHGSKSLKVLSDGYVVSAIGKRKYTRTIFVSTKQNGKSATIKSNDSLTFCYTFNEKVYTDYSTTYVVYFKYDGELYRATGSTSQYGLNQCTRLTHLVD